MRTRIRFLLVFGSCLPFPAIVRSDGFKITHHGFTSGGASAGGPFVVGGSMGESNQPLEGGGWTMTGGAMDGEHPCVAVDADGAVDLDDYRRFAHCVTGPDQALDAGCACLDLDRSGAIHLRDFAALQAQFVEP